MQTTELLSMLTTHWDKPSSANYYNDSLGLDILWFKTTPEEVAVTLDGDKKEFSSLSDALSWVCSQPKWSYSKLTNLK